MFEITEAKREASPILAAFIGQSGSGKTYSALLFMRGIVGPTGKIVVIDTEGGRSKIYADDPAVGGFLHIDFVEPFSSDRFREALRAAIAAGADGVIIDSASAEHEGPAGMLDYADQQERGGAKGRAKWIKPKMAHGRFMGAVRSAPAHIILCIREKIIIDVDVKPAVKVYLPACDRDLPFEMALTIRLEPETHVATFVKVPKPFMAHVRSGELVTVDHGRLLMAEAGKGERVNTDDIRTIVELEAAADESPDALKAAYLAAWKQAGPSDSREDLKKITAGRALLQKHSEGLKLRAEKAAQARADDAAHRDPDLPPDDEPGDIGSIRPAVAPNFENLNNSADGGLFKE